MHSPRPEEAQWTKKRRKTVSSKYRQEIINVLPFDLTERQADTVLRAIFDAITAGLLKGESIEIEGLGIFRPVYGKARPSIRMKGLKGGKGLLQPGEPYIIPAKYRIRFYPTRPILRELNKKENTDGNTSARD